MFQAKEQLDVDRSNDLIQGNTFDQSFDRLIATQLSEFYVLYLIFWESELFYTFCVDPQRAHSKAIAQVRKAVFRSNRL